MGEYKRMKKIKQIEKEQVIQLLGNGETVYRFFPGDVEIIDLECVSIAFIRKGLSDKRCLHFTIEEVNDEKGE